jgi:hypothetical protein
LSGYRGLPARPLSPTQCPYGSDLEAPLAKRGRFLFAAWLWNAGSPAGAVWLKSYGAPEKQELLLHLRQSGLCLAQAVSIGGQPFGVP